MIDECWKVAALYYFTALDDLPAKQAATKAFCLERGICGTLLLAPEGINGTIAGMPDDLDQVMAYLDTHFDVMKGEVKFSAAADKPFQRLKVRLKKEIVTLRAPEADPTKLVGTYVEPEDWNKLVDDPDVIMIDTRNLYETKIGMFKDALDPNTQTFTQFKDYVSKNLDPAKNRKVAMYCTGGIRCEKASSYMLAHGFEEVYHLKGGILKYLETIPADQTRWEGSCFVFDKRIGIDHGLQESVHKMCFGCREPLEPEDIKHAAYEPGVSCPHCIDTLTPERAEGLRMRQQQLMAQKSNEQH
ncbi:MAG: rhodanese-related sulfurtransferase [Rhodospirillales bacterium]|nr:rhodanese-related sulfurtransferase [Rhodospirillales bacterium]MCB9994952.1 rhodanese-related sulfurtransferase [Rhodospirillales bacterium]